MKEEYCNWTFEEVLTPYRKWLVSRDCGDEIELSRDSKKANWKAYKASLQPHLQGTQPPGATCPNCGKQVNGVNPYDDGETWRK